MVAHVNLIVVPTYEEALTIGGLLDSIIGEPTLARFRVLVVDDASPDGTAKVVRAHPDYGTRVHLLNRSGKSGLGPAYRAGFAWARDRGYDVVVQMDADGSHPVDAVPTLVAALEDADVAIGSRYVPGGRTVDWSWLRRLVSRAGNAYVRMMLGLPVHDCTAGFRAYRRAALALLSDDGTHAGGYSFQIESTWLAARRGMRMAEVPITFAERQAGQSKMSTAIVIEALWRVLLWRLRAGRARTRGMQEQAV
jgi:dolichol-phosphate mannosyltransferase